MATSVAGLLADRQHVLVGFDGPVCSVFSPRARRAAADRLRVWLGTDLSPELLAADDPFTVLRHGRSRHGTTAYLMDREFRIQELAAVATATATPGALDAVRALTVSGHTVTVVANNSFDAVSTYLAHHEIGRHVHEVSARHTEQLTPLAPDPFLLDQAMKALDTTADGCCVVGESIDDIEAARAAGIPMIAYAPKPEHRADCRAYEPASIIEHMTELATPATW